MNIETHSDAMNSAGYTIIERAIPMEGVARIREELSPWLQAKKMGRNDFEGLKSERAYALLAKAPSIAELVEHEGVLAIVDRILPKDYLLSAAIAINVHPCEKPQRFHGDSQRAKGVSAIWAFDDFTQDNGATEVIPGSHLWEDGREPKEEDSVKVIMPAGSVVVFAGNLRHRGGAHKGTATRLGVTPQYCHPLLRQIENMTLAVPPEIAGRYSDRIQALLGYSVCEPFIGYVDGMHPKRLIDSGYRGRKYCSDLPPS